MTIKTILLPAFILMLFSGSFVAEAQELEERSQLLEQKKLLDGRVEQLKQEQEELLFLKTIYATDSKYLVLELSNRTGQLRYKNRLLKEFSFEPGPGNRPGRGAVLLTRKREGPKGRRALLFGTSLIILPKNQSAHAPEILRLALGKKDFQAVFYALEEGARAYIIP